jgi:hypothetical protein
MSHSAWIHKTVDQAGFHPKNPLFDLLLLQPIEVLNFRNICIFSWLQSSGELTKPLF